MIRAVCYDCRQVSDNFIFGYDETDALVVYCASCFFTEGHDKKP